MIAYAWHGHRLHHDGDLEGEPDAVHVALSTVWFAEPGRSYVERRWRLEIAPADVENPSQLTQPVGACLGETGQLFYVRHFFDCTLVCDCKFRR
jgi:hypothetical protein